MSIGQKMKVRILIKTYLTAKAKAKRLGEQAYESFYQTASKLDEYVTEIFGSVSQEELEKIHKDTRGLVHRPEYSNQKLTDHADEKWVEDRIEDERKDAIQKSRFLNENQPKPNWGGCQQELL